MIFSSLPFIFGLLPIILLGSYVLKSNLPWWNAFLLLFSLIFYACGEPKYVFLMLFSCLANWIFAFLIERFLNASKAILFMAIAYNLSVLFVFKYLNWIISLLCQATNSAPFISVNLSLPIGISFYTFQALSYVIDVYRKRIAAQRSFICLALYITFFPQLIAGPIVRYVDIAPQITSRKMSMAGISDGMTRFMFGIGKKILIADSLAAIVERAFEFHSQGILDARFAWLGAIAYTLQIYYDFSGYSDMAIGLGRMVGFSLPENFNLPYSASSITDFWRKWHITLSQWFRDYVYIPLICIGTRQALYSEPQPESNVCRHGDM